MSETKKEKPGFMVYHRQISAMRHLEAEVFKKLMMAFAEYSMSGRTPEGLEGMELSLFEMYRERLDHDSERYDRRAEAGRKGGLLSGASRKAKSEPKQTEANRSNLKQTQANEPTTTTPTSTPTTTSTATSSSSSLPADAPEIIVISPKKEEEVFPPTREMIISYLGEKGWDADAEEFLTRCREAEWKDGNGQPVKNWRLWLKGFIMKHPAESAAGRCAPDPRIAALERLKRKYREEAGDE